MERVGDRSAAGGNAMKDRCRAFAWKSWMALAMVLALVGMVLAQAPRPGTRCPWSSPQPGGRSLEESPPGGGRPAGQGRRHAGTACAGDVSLHIAAPLV